MTALPWFHTQSNPKPPPKPPERRTLIDRRTSDLIRQLGGADAICNPNCTCRGHYTDEERRSTERRTR